MTEQPSEEPVVQDPALIDESGEPLATEPEPEVPEGGIAPVAAEPPPPPIEAPPAPESLAEQVYRESHTVPESTGPSDVVPNRPNIRAPEPSPEPSEAENEGVPVEEPVVEEEEPAGRALAADLIAQAEAAQTDEELDAIEAQADGRVTVLDAVEKRRGELA